MDVLERRAVKSNDQLDALPSSLGSAIKELTQYEFMDPDAHSQFQELMDVITNQLMQNYLRDVKGSIHGMGSQGMRGVKEMMRGLNEMLGRMRMAREPAATDLSCPIRAYVWIESPI